MSVLSDRLLRCLEWEKKKLRLCDLLFLSRDATMCRISKINKLLEDPEGNSAEAESILVDAQKEYESIGEATRSLISKL